MCGRYGFSFGNLEDIYDRWEIDNEEIAYTASFNIAPTQEAPVVFRASPNHISLVKWGFMPKWMEGKKGARALINARSDGLLTSKTYLKPLQFSRCIVPASFFFEWKNNGSEKVPYCIKIKDEQFFSIAGLLIEQDGVKAYVIITTEPNEIMTDIHNRMPVILNKEDEDYWLSPDNTEAEDLVKLLIPYPTELMEAYPVSGLVNSPRNNFPEVMKPISL